MSTRKLNAIQQRIEYLTAEARRKQREIDEINYLISIEKEKLDREKKLLSFMYKKSQTPIKLRKGSEEYITNVESLLDDRESLISMMHNKDEMRQVMERLVEEKERALEIEYYTPVYKDSKYFDEIREFLQEGCISNLQKFDETQLRELQNEAKVQKLIFNFLHNEGIRNGESSGVY